MQTKKNGTALRRSAAAALGAAAALALTASGASAQLIASDSYVTVPSGANVANGEYNDTQGLNNAAGAGRKNLGFVDGAYAGSAQYSSTTNGLVNAAIGAASNTSGKVNFGAAPLDNIVRQSNRGLAPVANSNTYWITHLVNRGNIPQAGGTGYMLTGFSNNTVPTLGPTSAFLAGLFVGFAQDGVANNFGNLVIRARTTAAQTAEDVVLLNGLTTNTGNTSFLVLMKVDVNVNGGSVDRVNWWVNPTDLSAESTLAPSAAASGAFDSFALQGGSDFARLNYSAQNWNGNVFLDEPRLGTTLQSVSGAAAIPEPGTMGLLLGGVMLGGGMVARRRRKTA